MISLLLSSENPTPMGIELFDAVSNRLKFWKIFVKVDHFPKDGGKMLFKKKYRWNHLSGNTGQHHEWHDILGPLLQVFLEVATPAGDWMRLPFLP